MRSWVYGFILNAPYYIPVYPHVFAVELLFATYENGINLGIINNFTFKKITKNSSL